MKEIRKRKIKALSLGRIDNDQIGFLTDFPEEEKLWYNVSGETEVLKELVKNVIAKGNIIEFEYNNNVVGSLKLIEKAPEKEEGFGDDTNFEALLNTAHTKFDGKFNIKTELISMDYGKKQALFSAAVSVEYKEDNVRVFTAHGDAEGITNKLIQPHFIRMAETRAICRALRWATNNAKVAEEEKSGVAKDNTI